VTRRIDTATEAKSLNDITGEWKIVARRLMRIIGANELNAAWDFCGSLADRHENEVFHEMAFAFNDGDQPHISVVTGRDWGGHLCLYARLYPVQLRKQRRSAMI
jgi:hypothetical protein